MMTEAEGIQRLFEAPGVFRTGHFVLASGLHSDSYFDKRQISGNVELLDLAANLLADLLEAEDIDAIISPEEGAIPFGDHTASELSRRYGRRVLFVPAKKDGNGGFEIDKRMLRYLQGCRIALVEDIFTTGESTQKTLEAIDVPGANVTTIVGLLDRSEGAAAALVAPIPLKALRTVKVLTMTEEVCRDTGLCAMGVEICTEPKVGHGKDYVDKHGQPVCTIK